jgi:nitrite reductase/ring-hydroxylating ferredoxin subunit
MDNSENRHKCACREGLDRRQLLQGTLMLAGVPPLCCVTPEAPAAAFTWDGNTLVLDLNQLPELKRTGAARAVVDASRKVNILVVHPDKKSYYAMDRACTHGGAMVAYHRDRGTVQCTSLNHAEYDMQGRLLHGRTHGNLRSYVARLAGSRLEIAWKESA